jgi:hypothetical protein
MRNYSVFNWGKIVNTLRFVCVQPLDDRPQYSPFVLFQFTYSVQNPVQTLISSIGYTRYFPRIQIPRLSLLISNFSPQSTPPITITANVKNKERQ